MISSRDWDRIRELFHGALELPPAARDAFVRERAGDAAILEEVTSLLRAHPKAEGFLSTPPGAGDLAGAVRRLSPGDRLGAFEILDLIGEGGMGEVYRARDTRLDRPVAVKVLSPALAGDPRGRERFEREARVISKLTHPHICTLHDVGSAPVDGVDAPFLVMELVEGETLSARLQRGALPLDHALQIGIEVVDALAAAHAVGIVHRDLKPANIMLTGSGAKLLDFGLARLRPAAVGDRRSGVAADDPLTREGAIVGTLPYMSPEQLKGSEADARSDLFAFGAVLYEMLTGTRAFDADSQAGLIAAILERSPAPIAARQPLVPPALDRLVATCLAKDPNDRWQDARDVVLALRGIADARSERPSIVSLPEQRPGGRAGAGVIARSWRLHAAWAAVALVVGLAMWQMRAAPVEIVPAANPRPVIVLMDSPLAGRVYDPRTMAAGGTNADDVSDALRDLPVLTFKENTSPMWHREEQVREQHPDLVISHLSCLLDQRPAAGDAALQDHLFNVAQSRLTGFFGYLAANNPRTRFLIYSRGRIWPTKEAEAQWTRDVVARFPHLNGRLFTMVVPGRERATFRDPTTASVLRTSVREILALP